MKLVDFFQFLGEQTRQKNIGNIDWQAPILVKNLKTGEELVVESLYISYDSANNQCVLAATPINGEDVF